MDVVRPTIPSPDPSDDPLELHVVTHPGAALGALGGLMLDAGYAVTDVAHALTATTQEREREDIRVGVFPQAVLVDDPAASGTRLHPASGDLLTFDQVGRAGQVVADARDGDGSWGDIVAAVRAVREDPRRRPTSLVVLGSGLMSLGIAVVFGAFWWSLVADALLGLLIGAVIVALSRHMRVAQLLPFLGAFVVTVTLCAVAVAAGTDRVPLFAVCAPLVILIPGAIVTNAVIELTAGDVVSGGGRFISGLVVWALLGAGIAAGAALAGAGVEGSALVLPGVAREGASTWGASVPTVLSWPATALVGIGVGLFFSASLRLTAVVVATLLLTYAVFVFAQTHGGIIVGTGVTAAVVLVATRALEDARPDYPSIVVFRPAYWLLVPGSFGLVALTSGEGGAELVRTTLGIVIALSVGTQVGALVVESASSAREAIRRAALDL